MPKLYMSSASGDDDHYVETFFDDLCRRVDAIADEPATGRSTLAVTPAGLSSWPAGMGHALATCEVFLALGSPRFFLNAACGRQWWAFETRLRRHELETGARPSALIPLAWTSDATLPSGLAPPPWPEAGLRQLVRLHGQRLAYDATLTELAERVVLAASGSPVAPSVEPLPPLADTPNAFATPGSQGGGTRIRFVVVAGTQQEMQRIRQNVTFYGATREQWAPYEPALGVPIAERARVVAAAHLFESEIGSIEEIVDRIQAARRDKEHVVVLVDAWAVWVDTCERVLTELDRRGLAGAAVLVPMSFTDTETAHNRRDLRFGLRRVFRNSTDDPNVRLRDEIGTPDQFDADLAGVIEEARNKSFRAGPIHHRLPGDPPGERPILQGP